MGRERLLLTRMIGSVRVSRRDRTKGLGRCSWEAARVEKVGMGGSRTSLRIQRGVVEVVHYVCDRLDRAIPAHHVFVSSVESMECAYEVRS